MKSMPLAASMLVFFGCSATAVDSGSTVVRRYSPEDVIAPVLSLTSIDQIIMPDPIVFAGIV